MASKIAEAYVQIVPRIDGVASSLNSQLSGPMAGVGDKAGTALGGGILSSIKRVAGPMAATLATVGVAKFLKDSVTQASNFQAEFEGVNQTFGKFATQVQDYAKTAAATAGMSEVEALRSAKSFGVFAKSAGLGGAEAAKFSTSMVQLAGDLGSFNDVPTSEALAAIQSGLLGQSEPLRRFGVLLDDATLKARAMEMGIYSGNGSLTAQQKVLAAQAEIMAQTGLQQGDFLKYATDYGNAVKTLSSETSNMQAAVGQALLPALASLAVGLTPLVQQMAPALSEFVAGLAPAITAVATVLPTLLTALLPLLPAFGQLVTVAGELIAAILPPLVQIIIALMPVILALVPPVIQVVQAFMPLITTILPPLTQLIQALIPVITFLIDGALKLLVPILEQVIAFFGKVIKGTAELVTAFTEVGKQFVQIGKNIVSGLLNGLKSAWNTVTKWVSDAANGIANTFKSVLGIKSPSRVFDEFGQNIGEGLVNGMDSMQGAVEKSAAELGSYANKGFTMSLKELTAAGSYGTLAGSKFFTATSASDIASYLNQGGVLDVNGVTMADIKAAISADAAGGPAAAKGAKKSGKDYYSSPAVMALLEKAGYSFADGYTRQLEGKFLQDLSNRLTGAFSNTYKDATGRTMVQTSSPIVELTTEYLNSQFTAGAKVAGSSIAAVQTFIDKQKANLAAVGGGALSDYSRAVALADIAKAEKLLPKLAAGGFVNRPTTAIIGEAGPEVVTPLKDFERMMGITGGAKTLVYNAAPNESIDREEALFKAMRRAKVVAGW